MIIVALLEMTRHQKILISGADGLVGSALSTHLLDQGVAVHALTRRKDKAQSQDPSEAGKRYFHWDPARKQLDAACLNGVTGIVHLAGESIGGGRWTARRKKVLLESRIDSIRLIFDALRLSPVPHQVHTVVSASATGIYQPHPEHILVEDSPVGNGFLAEVCQAWEQTIQQGGAELGLRTVMLRSGVVWSREGGMYAQLADMTRRFPAVIPGSGRQWMPWVHIQDAVRAYAMALYSDRMEGPYNLVAPDSITLGDFMHALAENLEKKVWLPPVPAPFVRLGLGEMSSLLLDSLKVSPSRLMIAGFNFYFPTATEALRDLQN